MVIFGIFCKSKKRLCSLIENLFVCFLQSIFLHPRVTHDFYPCISTANEADRINRVTTEYVCHWQNLFGAADVVIMMALIVTCPLVDEQAMSPTRTPGQ